MQHRASATATGKITACAARPENKQQFNNLKMNHLFFKRGALACTALGLAQLAYAESSEEIIYELDEYIVSAGPGQRSIADYASPVNILTSEELTRESSGTLGDVLDWQPGVTSSSFSAGCEPSNPARILMAHEYAFWNRAWMYSMSRTPVRTTVLPMSHC